MKSKWNLAAFAVMALTVVAHVFGGEPEIWLPVYESNLADVVRFTFGFVWHGLTLMFVFMAGLNLVAYYKPHYSAGLNIGLASINFAIGSVALVYGFVQTGGVLLVPQWILFLPMAAFSYLAFKTAQKAEI